MPVAGNPDHDSEDPSHYSIAVPPRPAFYPDQNPLFHGLQDRAGAENSLGQHLASHPDAISCFLLRRSAKDEDDAAFVISCMTRDNTAPAPTTHARLRMKAGDSHIVVDSKGGFHESLASLIRVWSETGIYGAEAYRLGQGVPAGEIPPALAEQPAGPILALQAEGGAKDSEGDDEFDI
jgi:hypothetical protein